MLEMTISPRFESMPANVTLFSLVVCWTELSSYDISILTPFEARFKQSSIGTSGYGPDV